MTEPGQISATAQPPAFKRCSLCGQQWTSRETFLSDPRVRVVGYQAFVHDSVLGLYLFNHTSCGTTVTIRPDLFEDLYEGPVYSEALRDTELCFGACAGEDDLQPCPNECECAWARAVLQKIRAWPKRS